MDVSALEAAVVAFASPRLPELAQDRCVLAVSGGADSTAMAALLVESGLIDAERCVVGHFDHRLRDREAAALDRAAVEALCARYSLELAVDSWDAPRVGELHARDARYAALASIADRHRARAIITGHTADDQAETVLMHAMRGAGLHGLSGMAVDAPLAGRGDLRVWRPLLATSREDTRTYCDARGLAYRDDASNEDRGPLRNRLRLDLLPAMAKHAPNIRASLVALAERSREAAASIDAVASALLPETWTRDVISLARRPLSQAPLELRPHVFRLAIERVLGDARDIERRHYARLAAAVDAQTGVTIALPRGLVLSVDAEEIHVSRGPLPRATVAAGFEADLPFDGIVGGWQVRIVPAGETLLSDGGIDLRLPQGALLRGRRAGDRVRTRAGGKKLGDWYTDRKIPVRERESAPVIAYGGEVLWTPWGALGELPHGRAWRIIAERHPHGAESAPA
jgi:tRNA(Ile)-lysidine synthase